MRVGVGGWGEGWEFELSTLVWRLRRSGCNMTRARGQSLRAKVTTPPANGVAAARQLLGVGNTPPQFPPQLRLRVRAASADQ